MYPYSGIWAMLNGVIFGANCPKKTQKKRKKGKELGVDTYHQRI